MNQIIIETLHNHREISKIQDISISRAYLGKSYKHIYKFLFNIEDIEIPMIMGVPNDWDRRLIDIYIANYKEFKYIPHIGSKGDICLFDIEGVLIDKNFKGLLNQTLDRVYTTIYNGLSGLNKQDFIGEFDQYWGQLPRTKLLKSMINLNKDTRIIKFAKIQKEVKRAKGDKHIDMIKKNNDYRLICSDSGDNFNLYKDVNNIKNGVYIYLETEDFIYPPDWRNDLSIEYINNMLNHKSLEKDILITLFEKCRGELMLVFNISQPKEYMNLLAVNINNYILDKSAIGIKLISNSKLIPYWVTRCDDEFLINRGGALSHITDKRILVIGCGSIGGYLTNELIKTGIKNITIVDGDVLSEENIYRHFLGMEYIGNYKTKAIVDYFNKNIPNLNLIGFQDDIEDLIDDESISFSDYDLVISAVGNHNLNRWINELVNLEKSKVPAIYLWNEILGIGSHIAFISNSYKGCYECLFGYNEEGVYDKSSYCEQGQTFIKRLGGCSSSYLPFSSTTSITTVINALEVIRNYFENRVTSNFLLSIKGDNYYLKKEGYKTSNRYNKQDKKEFVIDGERFQNKDCVICGWN